MACIFSAGSASGRLWKLEGSVERCRGFEVQDTDLAEG